MTIKDLVTHIVHCVGYFFVGLVLTVALRLVAVWQKLGFDNAFYFLCLICVLSAIISTLLVILDRRVTYEDKDELPKKYPIVSTLGFGPAVFITVLPVVMFVVGMYGYFQPVAEYNRVEAHIAVKESNNMSDIGVYTCEVLPQYMYDTIAWSAYANAINMDGMYEKAEEILQQTNTNRMIMIVGYSLFGITYYFSKRRVWYQYNARYLSEKEN